MAVVAAALRMARLGVCTQHKFRKGRGRSSEAPTRASNDLKYLKYLKAIKSHVPRPLPGYYRALATRFVSPQESGRRAAASIGVGDSRPASPRWLIDFIKEEGVQRIRESLFQM